MSLPSRERGLKLLFRRLSAWFFHVAPLAGAWIEINIGAKLPDPIRSLPSRERGLKFVGWIDTHKWSGRSPRGSVD